MFLLFRAVYLNTYETASNKHYFKLKKAQQKCNADKKGFL